MIKLTSRLLSIFVVLFLLSATDVLAQNTHSVWSKRPLYLRDGETGKNYSNIPRGYMATAWTEGTVRAYFRAVGKISATLVYDFELVKTTSTNVGQIEGLYDIKRSGVLVCDDCVGKAYLLNGALGTYFKLYVGTPAGYEEKWHYSGYITSRFDFSAP
jgi:hypothetical protein